MKIPGVIVFMLALPLVALGLSGCAEGTTAQSAPGTGISMAAGQQQGVWVNGHGSVSAAPDICTLQLGIDAQATTVNDAQSQAAKAMDGVMNALTSNGVAKKDIQTQQYSIQRVTRYDQPTQKEVFVGYRVSNIVSAKIRAIDKTGTVIDAVTAAGGDLTRIDSISFSIEDPAPSLQAARQKAMADARAKADQLASLAGIQLGKPTYISDNSQGVTIPQRSLTMAAGVASAPVPTTPISSGEMQVTVDVQVVYSIN